jgi:hypothetical protein
MTGHVQILNAPPAKRSSISSSPCLDFRGVLEKVTSHEPGWSDHRWYSQTSSIGQEGPFLTRTQLRPLYIYFFLGNLRCSVQFMYITTNLRIHWTPCKSSRQVRHREDDKRARWDSNPGDRGKETLPLPLGYKPRCNVGHHSLYGSCALISPPILLARCDWGCDGKYLIIKYSNINFKKINLINIQICSYVENNFFLY